MESMAWIVYVIHVLHSVGVFMAMIGGGLLAASIIASIISLVTGVPPARESDLEFSRKALKFAKFGAPVGLLMVFLAVVVPNRDTMYTMVGVHFGQKAVTSEEVQNVSKDGLEYLNTLIEKKTEELQENTETE